MVPKFSTARRLIVTVEWLPQGRACSRIYIPLLNLNIDRVHDELDAFGGASEDLDGALTDYNGGVVALAVKSSTFHSVLVEYMNCMRLMVPPTRTQFSTARRLIISVKWPHLQSNLRQVYISYTKNKYFPVADLPFHV